MAKVIIVEDTAKALGILREAGMEARMDDALDYALDCEAEYRLNCYLENFEGANTKYKNLSEDKQAQILDGIATRYNECSSPIFDYDYMDDIVDEEFAKVVPEDEVE